MVLLGVLADSGARPPVQARAVDTGFAPGLTKDEATLIARHTPILMLGAEDYDAIDARIFLDRATTIGPDLDIGGIEASDNAGYKALYDSVAPDYERVAYANVQMQPSMVLINYWLFYFYNLAPGGVGHHEGDWERVQVRILAESISAATELDPKREAGRFSLAVSRHVCDTAGRMPVRPWTAITSEGTHPVVFVGLGSHANYFEPGVKRAGHDGVPCTFIDSVPGDRRLDLRAVVIDCATGSPDWLGFIGRWGERGPRGPCQHEALDRRIPPR